MDASHGAHDVDGHYPNHQFSLPHINPILNHDHRDLSSIDLNNLPTPSTLHPFPSISGVPNDIFHPSPLLNLHDSFSLPFSSYKKNETKQRNPQIDTNSLKYQYVHII